MLKPKSELTQALATGGEAVVGIGLLSGLGAWGGTFLDGKFHTTPLLAIVLSLLGLGLGLTRMVVKALQSEKESDAKNQK